MADVELARRVVDEAGFIRFLVIKRIQSKFAADRAFVRMFTDEARISAELQQENIAQVYDFGQVGEVYFLAMEYVPGVNLRHVQRILAGRGQVPPFRVTFRVLADVLSALQYAHHRVDTYGRPMRLVHRDVNPRNIMLSVRGEVKLIDFGVAKADTRVEHTVGKSMKGKFAYMAPEQIEGNAQVDGRTDLFAVGLVMHELVAGRSPFAGMTEVQIVHQTIAGQLPPLKVPSLFPEPELLRRIHDRALAKAMEDRYSDASAMREDIVVAANAVGGLASREEMAEFLRKVSPDDVGQITNRLKSYRDEPPPITKPPKSEPPLSTEARRVEAASRVDETYVPPEPLPVPRGGRTTTHPLAWLGVVGLVLLSAVALGLALMLPPRTPAAAQPVATTALQATPIATQPPVEDHPESPASSTTTSPLASVDPSQDGSGSHHRLPHVDATAPSEDPVQQPEQSTTTVSTPESATEMGFLNVSSAPDRGLDVYVDDVKVGLTPIKSYRLAVGPHTVVIKDERSGRSWERRIRISEGNASLVTTRSSP
jgi:serine/threonine-protein kinase